MQPIRSSVLAILCLAPFALSACVSTEAAEAAATIEPARAAITEAEVVQAQTEWGGALVAIATEYDTNGFPAAKRVAEQAIDSAYGYNLGPVLFKPTLAAAPTTFRTTRDSAIAYFVGSDANYPGDTGFALKGWRKYKIDNAAIYIEGDTAITMGNVHLVDAQGKTTTVDKTFGFQRDEAGKLRIVLHHSSLPYRAN